MSLEIIPVWTVVYQSPYSLCEETLVSSYPSEREAQVFLDTYIWKKDCIICKEYAIKDGEELYVIKTTLSDRR